MLNILKKFVKNLLFRLKELVKSNKKNKNVRKIKG